mmetsp:Transcript_23771/g.54919  ORF Transcript_23771/g.54919 Transcript_23771/m.54919 type:complete len:293 (-) Transcript_23771:131-1009(-)
MLPRRFVWRTLCRRCRYGAKHPLGLQLMGLALPPQAQRRGHPHYASRMLPQTAPPPSQEAAAPLVVLAVAPHGRCSSSSPLSSPPPVSMTVAWMVATNARTEMLVTDLTADTLDHAAGVAEVPCFAAACLSDSLQPEIWEPLECLWPCARRRSPTRIAQQACLPPSMEEGQARYRPPANLPWCSRRTLAAIRNRVFPTRGMPYRLLFPHLPISWPVKHSSFRSCVPVWDCDHVTVMAHGGHASALPSNREEIPAAILDHPLHLHNPHAEPSSRPLSPSRLFGDSFGIGVPPT